MRLESDRIEVVSDGIEPSLWLRHGKITVDRCLWRFRELYLSLQRWEDVRKGTEALTVAVPSCVLSMSQELEGG